MATSSTFSDEVGKRYNVGHVNVEIKTVIAEGGFGVVFLVVDNNGRPYALKRLYVNDNERLKECRNEIDIMSSLRGYKHIVKYIDSAVRHFKDGDVHEILILMEYCPRSVLKRLQQGVRYSESDVMKIFCALCEAVAILHHCQIPVIHRDIKIENILMNGRQEYVLCDFGSATTKEYHVDTSNTQSILKIQDDINKHTTPSHRAPELIDLYSQVTSTIGTKLDIWAMGVTLYRLCFHQLPFGEGSLGSASQAINIPEDTKCSQPIIALIYYCLTVNSNERPNIYQVASAAFQIAQLSCPVLNKYGVSALSVADLIHSMQLRHKACVSSKPVSLRPDNSDWVETTTIKPRQRPKAGQGSRSSNSTPTHQINTNANQMLIDTETSFQSSTSQPFAVTPSSRTQAPLPSNPFGDDFSTFSFTQSSSNGAPASSLVNVSANQNVVPSSSTPQVPPRSAAQQRRNNGNGFSSDSPFGDDFSQYPPSQLQGLGQCPPNQLQGLVHPQANTLFPTNQQSDFHQAPIQHHGMNVHNDSKNTELDLFGATPFSASTAPRAFDANNMMWS